MCPDNEVYKTTGPDPDETCIKASERNRDFDKPRCVCVNGYVRTEPKGSCIPMSQCSRGMYGYMFHFV